MKPFCGIKCATCCSVTSVWGIVFLVIVGALFKMRATALIHDVAHNTEEDMDKAANTCWMAAGCYVVTLGLSAFNIKAHNAQPPRDTYAQIPQD